MSSEQPGAASQRLVERAGRSRDEISLLSIVNFLLRHRRLVVGLPLLAAVIVVGLNMTRKRTWTSSASFVPQNSSERLELAGLAAQFGFSIGQRESSQSPAFYVRLLTSRTILEPLATTTFTGPGGRQVTLVDVYTKPTGSAAERLDRTLRELRKYVSASTTRETGVITLSVTAPTPSLAAQAGTRILELLNDFNVRMRQSQAGAEREFAGARLGEVRDELRQAESRQQQFLQRNRQWEGSPELRFQHDRLERAVVSRAGLVNALEQRFEQARIDEVRTTPVVTVMETPSTPVRPNARNTVGRGILALASGFVLALIISLLRDIPRRAATDENEEYMRFVQLRQDARADLLPWVRSRRKSLAADAAASRQPAYARSREDGA